MTVDPDLEVAALRERLVRQGEDYLGLEAAVRDLRDRVEVESEQNRAAAEHWKAEYEAMAHQYAFVTTSRSWRWVLRARRLRDRLRGPR
ncbi:MAG: hypothetical protein QOK05_3004 [Chloroflexota bacterium]|jgi:hypothetical protein|nr:hypothetical protein [Chloroflexota bacterium]